MSSQCEKCHEAGANVFEGTLRIHEKCRDPDLALPERTYTDEFVKAHRLDRSVYDKLVEHVAHGLSVKAGIEVMRSTGKYKINNNHASRYARLIGLTRPDLMPSMRVRKLRTT